MYIQVNFVYKNYPLFMATTSSFLTYFSQYIHIVLHYITSDSTYYSQTNTKHNRPHQCTSSISLQLITSTTTNDIKLSLTLYMYFPEYTIKYTTQRDLFWSHKCIQAEIKSYLQLVYLNRYIQMLLQSQYILSS